MFVVTETNSEQNRIVCYGCLVKNLKEYTKMKILRQSIVKCELCKK